MEAAVVAKLKQENTSTKKDVIVEVNLLKDNAINEELYIKEYIDNLDGNFTVHKHYGRYHYYKCERSRKPRGKSTGLPSKTRANSCSAYVSFKFQEEGSYTACVIKCSKHHSGHDITDPSQLTVSRIHPELVSYIHALLSLGKSNIEALLASVKWSKERGHHDKHDRMYFPTPEDIKYLRKSYERLTHHDPNDAVSTDHLLRSDLREEVVFYQQKSSNNDQPLIIVLQSVQQLEDFKKFGANVVFVDASYSGLTCYGYAVYIMSVRNSYGHGVPVASAVLSEENTALLSICFTKLRERSLDFYPRCFMVDKDLKLLNAIKEVYQDVEVAVILCWFHVLQSVHRWLVSASGGAAAGAAHKQTRQDVIDLMRKLKLCRTDTAFEAEVQEAKEYLPQKIKEYLSSNWFNIGGLWANFGRLFFHEESNTNNISERFFLRLKYQFLKGIANRRVDDLLLLLSTSVKQYFDYIAELQECGRLKSKSPSHAREAAQNMLEGGVGTSVIWTTPTNCIVPSQSIKNVSWPVDLLTYVCSCPVADMKGGCKHIHLGLLLASSRGSDIVDERRKLARHIQATDAFIVEGAKIIVLHEEWTGVYDLKAAKCSCVAFSQGIECICSLLVALLDLTDYGVTEDDLVQTNESSNEVQHAPEDQCHISVPQLLAELNTWASSEEYHHIPGLEDAVKNAHCLAFGQFNKNTRKRNIHPLHPYRKQIEKRKTEVIKDHTYEQGTANRQGKKQKTPMDFKKITSTSSTKKKHRVQGISKLYSNK